LFLLLSGAKVIKSNRIKNLDITNFMR